MAMEDEVLQKLSEPLKVACFRLIATKEAFWTLDDKQRGFHLCNRCYIFVPRNMKETAQLWGGKITEKQRRHYERESRYAYYGHYS